MAPKATILTNPKRVRATPVDGKIVKTILMLAIVVGVGNARRATADDALILEVAAGDRDRAAVPVATDLPLSLRNHRHFKLTRLDNGQAVPVQVDGAAGKPRVVWVVRDTLQAGKVRQYRLVPATGTAAAAGGVTVKDDGKHLLVRVGEKPVLRYNHALVPSHDPKQPCYARSGYIHPVYNPAGQVVTDDLNPVHAHQHGIWFAWRHTTFEGRSTDGWHQAAGLGKVEHVKTDAFGGGPVLGHFSVRMRQVDLTSPDGPTPVLNETWRVRVYGFSDHFVFDLESTQVCAGDSPLLVDKCHYGGMAIRGHRDWLKRGACDYLTDEGKTREDGNHSRPRWCEIHGRIDGRMTGMVVMDHPGNFRFPQPVRLCPTLPYFCFAPAVLGSFTLKPGEPYVSRYRFYVHDGKLDPDMANRLWQDFASPPKVHIRLPRKDHPS